VQFLEGIRVEAAVHDDHHDDPKIFVEQNLPKVDLFKTHVHQD
jgi:hypothetical protein